MVLGTAAAHHHWEAGRRDALRFSTQSGSSEPCGDTERLRLGLLSLPLFSPSFSVSAFALVPRVNPRPRRSQALALGTEKWASKPILLGRMEGGDSGCSRSAFTCTESASPGDTKDFAEGCLVQGRFCSNILQVFTHS